jgi:hypothetical protein
MSNKFPDSEDTPRMTGERPVVSTGPSHKQPTKSAPRWIGLLMIMASLGFTFGTIILLLTNKWDDLQISLPTQPVTTILTASPTELIQQSTATAEMIIQETFINSIITENMLPTIALDPIQTLLSHMLTAQTVSLPLWMLTTGSLRSFRDYSEDYGVDDRFTIVDTRNNYETRI